MSRFTFTSPEDLRERIISALDEAEKRAKTRTMPRERLGELVEAVASRPWGYAAGDGGSVAKSYRYRAETTEFALAWYTWRGEKHIFLSASRGYAERVRYGSDGYLSIEAGDRRKAYDAALPDRAPRYHYLRNQRHIRDYTRHLPPLPAGVGEITTIRPDVGGLVVAETDRWETLVGTPAGWLRVPRQAGKKPAWNILADLGFPVPRRKSARVWNDELTVYAAMHVLGGDLA